MGRHNHMKKLFVILAVLVSSFVNAQTIGDHLNDIMEMKPGGKFDTENVPTYSILGTNSLTIYFLNSDLRCDRIAISPKTALDFQGYVESFNKGWVIVDDKHWKYYRDDGSILGVEARSVEGVGMVFFIVQLASAETTTGGSRN